MSEECGNNENTTTKRKRIQLEKLVKKTDENKDVQNNSDIYEVVNFFSRFFFLDQFIS